MIDVLHINIKWLAAFILVLPAAAVLLLRFAGEKVKWLGGSVSTGTAFLLSITSGLLLLIYIYRGNSQFIVEFPGPWLSVGGLDIRLAFQYDALSLIFLASVHFITFIILASIGVLRSGESPSNGFFASLMLCLFSLSGLISSSDLFVFYFFWMTAGVSCFWLIESELNEKIRGISGLDYFLQDGAGGLLLLICLLSLSAGYAMCDWQQIAFLRTEGTQAALYLRLGIFGGFLSAVFCRSNILPCNLLSSSMDRISDALKTFFIPIFLVFPGSYLFIRISPCVPQILLDGLALYFPLAALMLVLIASFQSNPVKIISYLAGGEVAFIFSSLCAGMSTAGIIHIFVYSFCFIVILIVAGFESKGGLQRQKNSTKAEKAPRIFESAAFIIAGLSLAGFPSTAGFISKSAVVMKVIPEFDFSAMQIIPLTALGGVIFLFVMNITRLYFLLFTGGGALVGANPGIRRIPAGARLFILLLLVLQIPTIYTLPSFFPFSADGGWLSGLKYDESLFFRLSSLADLAPLSSGGTWMYIAGAYALILCMGSYLGYVFHKKSPAIYRKENKPLWISLWKKDLYIQAFWRYPVTGGLKMVGALLCRFERFFDFMFSVGQHFMAGAGDAASGLDRLFIIYVHDKMPSFAVRVNRFMHPFIIFETDTQIIVSISMMVLLLFFFLFFML